MDVHVIFPAALVVLFALICTPDIVIMSSIVCGFAFEVLQLIVNAVDVIAEMDKVKKSALVAVIVGVGVVLKLHPVGMVNTIVPLLFLEKSPVAPSVILKFPKVVHVGVMPSAALTLQIFVPPVACVKVILP
jgi:hypothetical protein